jgi:hypothetical protein
VRFRLFDDDVNVLEPVGQRIDDDPRMWTAGRDRAGTRADVS